MNNIDRRTIDELLTLYELEPTVRDIFVEGPSDRAFFGWYVRARGNDDARIYSIDSVEVPRSLCEKYDLPIGNRSEVIAVALELNARSGSELPQVTCVADADLEGLEWPWLGHPHLLKTDYPALESYGFSRGALARLLSVFLPSKLIDHDTAFEAFTEILKVGFSLRKVNERPEWGCRWIPLSRTCILERNYPRVEVSDAAHRLLNACGRVGEMDGFTRSVLDVLAGLDGNPRHYAYGRDFTDVLGWYIRSIDASTRCSDDAAKRAALLTVDVEELGGEKLFQELILRAAG